MIGSTVAHFHIEAELGRGGMGVVYRARDETLGRTVALKLLLPDLVNAPVRRARFVREARIAAAVNHANVATVYEVGEAEDTVYLAMELVEGESLRELVVRERPPIERALEIATAVAGALAAAHAARVIHRDLKPANVLLGRRGEIKLCDFGLAKLFDADASPADQITRDSVILGTPAYMSPEQCRGRQLDPRSDLFSLGTMLYELVAGRRPFVGESYPELGTAIMYDAPPPLDGRASPALAKVIARCLEKRPEDRYPDAQALLADLARVTDGAAPLRTGRRRLAALGAAGAVTLGMGTWLATTAWVSDERAPARSARETQLTALAVEVRVDTLAVAPDGTWYAYANAEGTWIARTTGDGAPEKLDLADGDVDPNDVFPGGRRLLVRQRLGADVALGILDLDTRRVATLRRAPYRFGLLRASLASDGTLITYFGDRGLRVMSADGADDRLLVPFSEGEGSIAQAWSPDGRYVAFIRDRWTRDGWNSRLEVAAADGSSVTAPRTEGFVNQPGGVDGLAWLAPDRLVYGAEDGRGGSVLWMMGIRDGAWDGSPQQRLYAWPDAGVDWLRPAGGSLFFVKNSELGGDVLIAELGADGALVGEPARLPRHGRYDFPSAWTQRGKVLFVSDQDGNWDLFVRDPDERARPAEVIAKGPTVETGAVALGDRLLYWRIADGDAGSEPRCALIRRDQDGTETTILRTDQITRPESAPPHCARVACTPSDPTGCVLFEDLHGEVIVSRFDPSEDVVRRLPTRGRRAGALSPDGREVAALMDEGRRLAIVDLDTGAERILNLEPTFAGYSVVWRPDAPGWLMTGSDDGRGVVASIDPSGAMRTLWSRQNVQLFDLRLSPDGRNLAILARAIRCDVWRLDGLPAP